MLHLTLHLKDAYPALAAGGCDPTLTLYLPCNLAEMNQQNRQRPNILLCPGGGYSYCSEREAEPIALKFLPAGYNVFVLNYSVKPHGFPTQLREVAAAVEMICGNAKQWNADPGRIAIMGFSAGGHLAAHYSTCYDCPEVRQMFPNSKPVQASVLCYPVISADSRYFHQGTCQVLSGHAELTPEDVEKYSCQLHVSEHTPPAFLWHTAADPAVPVMNSLLYAQALAAYKIPFALHIYPNGQHGLATVDEETCGALEPPVCHAGAWINEAIQWLRYAM